MPARYLCSWLQIIVITTAVMTTARSCVSDPACVHMQEDSAPGNMSVFDRLAGGKAKPAVQSRLSKPSSMEVDSRSVWRPAKRPISDARELLLEAVAAKVCCLVPVSPFCWHASAVVTRSVLLCQA